MRKAMLVATLLSGLQLAAQESNLLPANDLPDGLQGWEFSPGPASYATVETDGGDGRRAVKLAPEGTNWGLDSAPLTIGKEILPDRAYEASAALRSAGIGHGLFAFSVCAYDAAGKRLVQLSAHRLSAKSEPHDWQVKTLSFGSGTPRPLPAATQTVRLRFSFYDPEGKPTGTVFMRDPAVTELPAAEPGPSTGWPASVLADVGELQVRFESRSFWTLYRIDYRDTRLCVDHFGSHYGTVANFAGTGFIGSGHTENEDEKLLELAFAVDGKPCPKPAEQYKADRVELRKRSRLRDLHVDTLVAVADNRIVEDVRLRTEQPAKMNLIYHFMHPWTPQMSDYLAELADGTRLSGEFVGDEKQKICKPVNWSAVYSRELGMGAVTVVWDVPADLPWETRYWDMPPRYRKHYFTTFVNATPPKDQALRYRVATICFAASAEAWQEKAAALAAANPRPEE
jgi:hypothetical protein